MYGSRVPFGPVRRPVRAGHRQRTASDRFIRCPKEPCMSPRTRNWLTAYIVTALIFAVLDVAWILLVANPLYQSQIGGLLAPKANLPGAVLFYVIFVAGMVHYGVRPNHPDLATRQRVGGAALFGFFTYAT